MNQKFTASIAADLVKQLKINCVENDVTRNMVLEELVAGYLAGDFKLKCIRY